MNVVAQLAAQLLLDTTDFDSGITRSTAALNALKSATISATGEIEHSSTTINNTTTVYNNYTRSVDNATKAEKNLSQQHQVTNQMMGQTGMAMIAIGAGIIAAFGGMVKVAVDYDQALHNVDSIAHLTTSGFVQLHDSIIGLARDPNIVDGPKALATGMYDVYSSGFSGAQALDVLKVAAHGASAGMTDTAISSRVLMGVINSGIGGVESFNQVMDVLFQEVNLGVNDFSGLAGAIGQVLPTAKLLGVTIQDVSAQFALLTKHSLSVDESGTAINGMLEHILNPGAEAIKIFHTLGVQYGQTALQGKSFTDYLTNLTNRVNQYAEAHKKLQISKKDFININGPGDILAKLIPETRSFRALAIETNGGTSSQEFSDMRSQFSDKNAKGQTEEALKRQNEGIANQMKIFKKNMEILGESIGKTFLPMINQLLGGLTKISDAFGKLPPGVQKGIAVFTVISGALLVVVGGALQLISSWAVMTAALTAAGTTLGAVAASIGAVAWPLLLVAGLVALIGVAWTQDWGHIQEVTTTFIDWIKPYLKSAWAEISADSASAWAEISTDVGDAWSSLDSFAQDVWPDIRDIIADSMRATLPIMVGVLNGITEAWDAWADPYKHMVGAMWDALKAGVKAAWDVIEGLIKAYLKTMDGDFQGAADTLQQTWNDLWNVDFPNSISKGLQAGIDAITNFIPSVTKAGQKFFEGFKNGFNEGSSKEANDTIDRVLGINQPIVPGWIGAYGHADVKPLPPIKKQALPPPVMPPITFPDIDFDGKGKKKRDPNAELFKKYHDAVDSLSKDIYSLQQPMQLIGDKFVQGGKSAEMVYETEQGALKGLGTAQKQHLRDLTDQQVELSRYSDTTIGYREQVRTLRASIAEGTTATEAQRLAYQFAHQDLSAYTEAHRKHIKELQNEIVADTRMKEIQVARSQVLESLTSWTQRLDDANSGVTPTAVTEATRAIAAFKRQMGDMVSDPAIMRLFNRMFGDAVALDQSSFGKQYKDLMQSMNIEEDTNLQHIAGQFDPLQNAIADFRVQNQQLFADWHAAGNDTAIQSAVDLFTKNWWDSRTVAGMQAAQDGLHELQKTAMQMGAHNPMDAWINSFKTWDEETKSFKLPDGMKLDDLKQQWDLKQKLDFVTTAASGIKDTLMQAFSDAYSKGFMGFFSSVIAGFNQLMLKLAMDFIESELMQALQRTILHAVGAAQPAAGARAFGGDVNAGSRYIINEDSPEVFIPDRKGRVMNQQQVAAMAGNASGGNTFIMHVHGVTDANSFRQSEPQIMATISRRLTMANRRDKV